MVTSSNGLKVIKDHEGLRLTAYKCPADVWTIGWGHTASAREGMTITRAAAEELLKRDVAWAEDEVRRLPAKLNQNQFDALVSLIFNIGSGAFRGSTARRLIVENPNNPAIADAIKLWNKGGGRVLPGLVRRRAEEAELYFKI